MRQSSCSWMFCKFPIRKRCTLSIIWVHTSSGWSESVSSFLHPQISSIITRVYWRNVGRIAGLFWSWMTVFVCNGPMLKHLQGSVLGSILQSMYNIISYHIDMIWYNMIWYNIIWMISYNIIYIYIHHKPVRLPISRPSHIPWTLSLIHEITMTLLVIPTKPLKNQCLAGEHEDLSDRIQPNGELGRSTWSFFYPLRMDHSWPKLVDERWTMADLMDSIRITGLVYGNWNRV